ncbi:MAG: ASCH domain-containing protein [Alphaproteobacteria bacterium]|nr:ASCH domain-containing protein [Alphaproteobacteria bacterium]
MHKFSMINTRERPYLKWLKDGVKTAEGRVNTEKYQKIKIGDEVTFTDTKSDDFIRGIVTFKHQYVSFEEMLKTEGVKNMLPFLDDSDLEKGVQVYENFPGAERVRKFGCVAIGIKVTEAKLRIASACSYKP